MKPHFNNDKIGYLIIHVQTKNLIELDFFFLLPVIDGEVVQYDSY